MTAAGLVGSLALETHSILRPDSAAECNAVQSRESIQLNGKRATLPFLVHGVDENGAAALVKRLHRKQVLPFFSKLSPRRSAWRPAERHITGPARLPRWGMRSASSLHPT